MNMYLYYYLQQVKKKGVIIIVIDLIFNLIVKFVDCYIFVKSGMDGWFVVVVLKVLIEIGRMNEMFIFEYFVGFDDVKEFLNIIFLEEFIVKIEIFMEQLEYLVNLYVDGLVFIFMGFGMQCYKNGGGMICWIDVFVVVSGNVGIKGGGVNFGNV